MIGQSLFETGKFLNHKLSTHDYILFFKFVYGNLLQNNSLPNWGHEILYGQPIQHHYLALGFAHYIAIIIGKCFSIYNSFILFKLSILFDFIAFFIAVIFLIKYFINGAMGSWWCFISALIGIYAYFNFGLK